MQMREILFRGKRLDNGEWVEGAFLNDRGGAFYICPAVSDISYGDSGTRRRIGCWYKVAPSTVGQYTGLTDKNGDRIFEGDICKIGNLIYKVEFKYSEWIFTILSTKAYCFPAFYSHCGEHCEIIGNIHDNPELLEAPNA